MSETTLRYQGFHFIGIDGKTRRGLAAVNRNFDNNFDQIAISICHPGDQYSRKKARTIARNRLEANHDSRLRFLLATNDDGTRVMSSGGENFPLRPNLNFPEAIAECAEFLSQLSAEVSRTAS
jgi:hypothetical protein